MKPFRMVRRPAPPLAQHREIRRLVAREMRPIARDHLASRQRVVADWDNKPQFDAKLTVTGTTVQVVIFLKNPNQRLTGGSWTIGQLWTAIDKTGVRPHVIRARPGGVLRFVWNGPSSYQPHTSPPARFGGAGQVIGGMIIYVTYVFHPGFPPRKFTPAINKRLSKPMDQAIDRGYRIGAQRLTRG